MATTHNQKERCYICIDLKTFYASVECVDRGLDPFTTCLVVADPTRTETTICLAITPAMKALGVRNRCRVFEIPKDIDYIMARPRMHRYMEISAQIYGIYLEFVSPEDIHPYSIDECFIDATPYLDLYDTDARAFALRLMDAVRSRTGICATAGIGSNLFLCKVALDITAKHVHDHIGMLDQERFRHEIWPHRPITDIWGIGPGTATRLAKYGVYDLMGVAALDEKLLYREFGINAEYLIDHAFGREPTTIADIRAYKPAETSYANGQVLPENYSSDEAHLVLREMVDTSALELVDRGEVAGSISLSVGYAASTRDGIDVPADSTAYERAHMSAQSVRTSEAPSKSSHIFIGEHGKRHIGRNSYAHSGGSRRLSHYTNSFKRLWSAFEHLWYESIDQTRKIRRLSIGFGDLRPEEFATIDLFTDIEAEEREHDLAQAINAVKDRFGKNALIRGMSLKPKATARERNEQIGGHHA